MNIALTYVHHSSFVLHAGDRSFLFDFPGPGHLVDKAREVMLQAIEGRNLYVFNSHSHADHYNHDMINLTSVAKRAWYVLADDILDMHPETVPRGSLIVEPDESYEFMGLTVDTLMSNDLGVAFLIKMGDLAIYYGGDLGNWNWDSDPIRQRNFTEKFYSATLERIACHNVDIGFTNADKRLRSQCGAEQFVRRIRPKVFVPMHTHGHLEWLDDLAAPSKEVGSEMFHYTAPGFTQEFVI